MPAYNDHDGYLHEILADGAEERFGDLFLGYRGRGWLLRFGLGFLLGLGLGFWLEVVEGRVYVGVEVLLFLNLLLLILLLGKCLWILPFMIV